MKSKRTTIYVLLACLVLFGTTVQAQSWETAKEKDGIKISTKAIPGHTLKAFKGEVTLNAPIAKVVKVLRDIESYPNWMPDCIKSTFLEKKSANEYYQYVMQDAPWPVSDRDCITFCKIQEKSADEVIFTIKAVPDYIDEKSGMVRVPLVDSYWKVIAKGDNQTYVEYYAHSDPGGSLPDWLVNSAVVDTPFGTLEGLRGLVE